MKLLVIVLCLLSERFLIHASSHTRFYWFQSFATKITGRLNTKPAWASLLLLSLPISLLIFLLVFLFGGLLFGFIGLIINLLVLHYCLGPENPFYPISSKDESDEVNIGDYLSRVNEELFAVLFFYVVLGPFGAIFYRVIHLSRDVQVVKSLAVDVSNYLDWIPVRITSMAYLLVGNFQLGIKEYSKNFLLPPHYNDTMLREAGVSAVNLNDSDKLHVVHAERQVEHALILLLAIYSLFTIAAWL